MARLSLSLSLSVALPVASGVPSPVLSQTVLSSHLRCWRFAARMSYYDKEEDDGGGFLEGCLADVEIG